MQPAQMGRSSLHPGRPTAQGQQAAPRQSRQLPLQPRQRQGLCRRSPPLPRQQAEEEEAVAAAVAEAQVTGCLPLKFQAGVTCILLPTLDLPTGVVQFPGMVVGFCWTAGK